MRSPVSQAPEEARHEKPRNASRVNKGNVRNPCHWKQWKRTMQLIEQKQAEKKHIRIENTAEALMGHGNAQHIVRAV